MPVPAVTYHINKHIRIKFLAKTGGDLGTFNHRFGVIPVNMKYRGMNGSGQRSAVIRTARIFKICGKSDLVVDDKMNGSSRIVSIKLTHLQYFIDHTLA